MFRSLSTAARLTLGLAALVLLALCASMGIESLHFQSVDANQERQDLADAIAISIARSIQLDDSAAACAHLQEFVAHHPRLTAGVLETADGTKACKTHSHDAEPPPPIEADSSQETVTSIVVNGQHWGVLRLRFHEPRQTRTNFLSTGHALLDRALAAVGILLAIAVVAGLVLRRTSPEGVPRQVRATLDTLAEGVAVLDSEGRTILVNRAFASMFGVDQQAQKGKVLSELQWCVVGHPVPAHVLPWNECLETQQPVVSTTLQLERESDATQLTLLVNATPIEAVDGTFGRVIVSFDDITSLENKKQQLADMLRSVRESTDEIKRQNEELERLATRDSLTGCMNRRRLFEVFETEWKSAARHGHSLSCLMIDADHFKSINDNHGHATGDRVLSRIAVALRETARDTDTVARYGGEEFCILLSHTDVSQAEIAAERFREAVADIDVSGVRVTASLGVSVNSFGAADPQTLIDQADRALYAAKSLGRNRVIRFDEIPADIDTNWQPQVVEKPTHQTSAQNIPFHAVTALISALAYRDQGTAAHCRRVADLAVTAAEGLLGVTESYTLEIAALLHDLGKIGVPDNILLKSGRLTDDEWAVIRRHERIGVEIVRASFAFQPLTEIVSQYRTPYTIGGDELRVEARILAIADAFDAMVTDRPFRKGRTHDEAFQELRLCSSTQFDGQLVERFIDSVSNASGTIGSTISVAKETALSIGLQIEELASALDNQDLDRLGALAARLRGVAEQYGVDPLIQSAEGLVRAVSEESDLLSVLQSANDLLRLCRSTQRSYIEGESIDAN